MQDDEANWSSVRTRANAQQNALAARERHVERASVSLRPPRDLTLRCVILTSRAKHVKTIIVSIVARKRAVGARLFMVSSRATPRSVDSSSWPIRG